MVEPALEKASAVILGHSSQPDVQQLVASILFGKDSAQGKLSMSIGRLYASGEGCMAGYSMQVCDSLWLNDSFKKEYLKKIANAPLKDKRYRYSDLNFILLQQIVEQRTGMSLNKFLEREFYVPMGLSRTGYLPLSRQYGAFKKGLKSEIIPSNIDLFLRKELLQGFVHEYALDV